MKKILIGLAIVFLWGCDANYSVPAGDNTLVNTAGTTSQDDSQNRITFKVNGEEVKTTGWTISRFVWGNNTPGILMNITSSMHDDKRTINVNLDGSVPGNYPLVQGNTINKKSSGSYYPDYMDDMMNSFSFTSGAFDITSVDTVKNIVNGNFYGTVKNLKGDSFIITEGKIVNGILKNGITQY